MVRAPQKIFIFFLLFWFCSAFAAVVITIGVEGLQCPFCINVLKTNLKKIKGVQSADFDKDNKNIRIMADPANMPDINAIKKTLEDSGFVTLSVDEKTINKKHIDIKNQACNTCHT